VRENLTFDRLFCNMQNRVLIKRSLAGQDRKEGKTMADQTNNSGNGSMIAAMRVMWTISNNNEDDPSDQTDYFGIQVSFEDDIHAVIYTEPKSERIGVAFLEEGVRVEYVEKIYIPQELYQAAAMILNGNSIFRKHQKLIFDHLPVSEQNLSNVLNGTGTSG
jgi:hypothetical protein